MTDKLNQIDKNAESLAEAACRWSLASRSLGPRDTAGAPPSSPLVAASDERYKTDKTK